jgi:hypothetical protein
MTNVYFISEPLQFTMTNCEMQVDSILLQYYRDAKLQYPNPIVRYEGGPVPYYSISY